MSLFGAVADHYVAAGGGGTYDSEVLADSPLAYWRLGEASGTAFADSSGNGRNGAMITGTYTRGATGLLTSDATAKSTDFAGARGQVTFGSWMNSVTNAFTIEAVINADSVTSDRTIVAQDDDAAPLSELAWRLRISSGKLVAFFNQVGTLKLVTGATTLSTGTTYHVAATYDNTNLKVYVNGVLDGTTAATGTVNGSSQPIILGTIRAGSGSSIAEAFDGRIQEVAVYNTALSAARLAAHNAAR